MSHCKILGWISQPALIMQQLHDFLSDFLQDWINISAANRSHSLLHDGHSPWLCAVCSVWTWCRPWASHKGWAGTRWGEGCTDAPAPSSAWLLHAGLSSPAPRIEPDGGSKGPKGEGKNTMIHWKWTVIICALTSLCKQNKEASLRRVTLWFQHGS